MLLKPDTKISGLRLNIIIIILGLYMKKIFLLLLLATSTASASESDCLSKILYAEAQGEAFEGIVALGQTTITFAKKQKRSICKMTGVERANVPAAVSEYWQAVASQLLKTKSTSVSKGADHWNTGNKPQFRGKITRKIDHHVFYAMEGN